jgi:hypothetical protein
VSRGLFHWSSATPDLHPGLDPRDCTVCEDEELARLEAIAMHPASTRQETTA